jgi:glycosyltransferase involved in cell wall biosynthesis
LIPGGDRFEDFFDKIGVSLETFQHEFTGGWLFNYVRALSLVNVRTVLIFTSARVQRIVHFTHTDSGAPVWVLPSPRIQQKIRNARHRLRPESRELLAVASYVGTPLRALRRVIRDERCDALLCQEYEHPRFDVCVVLGGLLGLPVYATYQGANDTRSRLEQTFRPRTIRRCAGLIIPAGEESCRVHISYALPISKIGRIPNPGDVDAGALAERITTRAELGIGRTEQVVAWHGRVQIDKKGLDILLDAWDIVCAQRPVSDIRLLLVGSGRNAEALRSRLRSSQRVLWIDRYVFNRRELFSYLSTADVYAIPSRREGFAVAPLEAMACRLPVVASDAPGVVDLFPRGEIDGGFVVHGNDPAAFGAALLRLIDDPDLCQRMGQAGRVRIDREFSVDVVGPLLRRFMFPDDPQPR